MLTKHKLPDDIEVLFIEINFRKCKWLLCRLDHPQKRYMTISVLKRIS